MFVADMSAFWLIHFLKPLNVCQSPLTICTSYKVKNLYKHQRRRDWSSGIVRAATLAATSSQSLR